MTGKVPRRIRAAQLPDLAPISPKFHRGEGHNTCTELRNFQELLMAAIIAGKHIIISHPRYEPKLDAWRACASIYWNGDEFQHCVLKLEKIFQTEKEALAFGYAACRTLMSEIERPAP